MSVSNQLLEQYNDLRNSAVATLLPTRCQIRLTGKDRVKFLNNFCTADITKLLQGQATELFILDTRGKTLAFGHVFNRGDSLLISTADGSQTETLIAHLDKYIIMEDVNLAYESDSKSSIFVTGPDSTTFVPELEELAANNCDSIQIAETNVLASNIELADFGYLLVTDNADSQTLFSELKSRGVVIGDIDALHMLRFEFGTPWYGIEIDETNLPQEMRRDDKSISFTKGCYLGQETVAKIDAFGHVNKFLVAIEIPGDNLPEVGTEILAGEKKIGTIKSVSYSPVRNSHIAHGFVKCKWAQPENSVTMNEITGKIITQPFHT